MKLLWNDVQKLPAFVINLQKSEDRWKEVEPILQAAGFNNLHRSFGVDASNEKQLKQAWDLHGNPGFDPVDSEFIAYKGKQGCLLSHAGIWKKMIEENMEQALIFEDDVIFHPQFLELAPLYWEHTPDDFDLLYLGAQLDYPSKAHIARVPVFCTHAMLVTLKGAHKLYDLVMKRSSGVKTIDCVLKEEMEKMLFTDMANTFAWYVWNGTFFPTEIANMPKGWTKRNMGLVFQHEKWGSLVREW